jgi:hypothetical protein
MQNELKLVLNFNARNTKLEKKLITSAVVIASKHIYQSIRLKLDAIQLVLGAEPFNTSNRRT